MFRNKFEYVFFEIQYYFEDIRHPYNTPTYHKILTRLCNYRADTVRFLTNLNSNFVTHPIRDIIIEDLRFENNE